MKLISNKFIMIYLSVFIFSIFLSSIFSCKRIGSDLKVSGGEIISNQQYPGVILLAGASFDYKTSKGTKEDKGYSCTGSVLSSNTILTAAHCTHSKNFKYTYAVHPYKSGTDSLIPVKASYRHPSFGELDERGLSEDQISHDVAVWIFEDGTFSDITDRLQISSQQPSIGSDVMLVGWGCYTTMEEKNMDTGGYQYKETHQVCDNNKKPDKRRGSNRIRSFSSGGSYMTMVAEGKYQIDDKNTNPTGENVLSTPGDSGGPLLSRNDTKKIFGICSAGDSRLGSGALGWSDGDDSWLNSMLSSLYTNPVSRDNQNFLESVVDQSEAVIPGIQVGANVVEYGGKIKVLYKEESTDFNEKVEEHKVIRSFNNKTYNSVKALKQAWRNINFYNRAKVQWSFE